jgi:hypothetical protein
MRNGITRMVALGTVIALAGIGGCSSQPEGGAGSASTTGGEQRGATARRTTGGAIETRGAQSGSVGSGRATEGTSARMDRGAPSGMQPGTTGTTPRPLDRSDSMSGSMAGTEGTSSALDPQRGWASTDPSGTSPGATSPTTTSPTTTRARSCPADLAGLTVRATPITNGAALVFTSSSAQIDELRARLHRIADHHRQHLGHAGSPGATAMGSTGGTAGTIGGSAPGSASGATAGTTTTMSEQMGVIADAREIRVVETPDGARLEVVLPDRSRVVALRSEMREHATALREGRCPIALEIES